MCLVPMMYMYMHHCVPDYCYYCWCCATSATQWQAKRGSWKKEKSGQLAKAEQVGLKRKLKISTNVIGKREKRVMLDARETRACSKTSFHIVILFRSTSSSRPMSFIASFLTLIFSRLVHFLSGTFPPLKLVFKLFYKLSCSSAPPFHRIAFVVAWQMRKKGIICKITYSHS